MPPQRPKAQRLRLPTKPSQRAQPPVPPPAAFRPRPSHLALWRVPLAVLRPGLRTPMPPGWLSGPAADCAPAPPAPRSARQREPRGSAAVHSAPRPSAPVSALVPRAVPPARLALLVVARLRLVRLGVLLRALRPVPAARPAARPAAVPPPLLCCGPTPPPTAASAAERAQLRPPRSAAAAGRERPTASRCEQRGTAQQEGRRTQQQRQGTRRDPSLREAQRWAARQQQMQSWSRLARARLQLSRSVL